jgi:hypothetical protein
LLSASAPGRKLKAVARDEIVKDSTGAPLFRIRQQSSSIAVLLPIEKTSAQTLESVRCALRNIFQHATFQSTDSPRPESYEAK